MDELSPRGLSFLVAAILYADEARSALYGLPSLFREITQGLKADAVIAHPRAPQALADRQGASADEVLAWLEKKQAL